MDILSEPPLLSSDPLTSTPPPSDVLPTTEVKKKSSGVNIWYAIAAGFFFILMIIIIILYLGDNTPDECENEESAPCPNFTCFESDPNPNDQINCYNLAYRYDPITGKKQCST
jgi:hypothetical protein